jgi:hypothetical protein
MSIKISRPPASENTPARKILENLMNKPINATHFFVNADHRFRTGALSG